MSILIDHTNPTYVEARNKIGLNKYNGAYYYSKEIVQNIIPLVKTDRNWITIETKTLGCDHSIVFVHNRKHPEWYEHYSEFDDIIFVCSIDEYRDSFKHLGKTIYLPLSVDVDYVKQFRTEKDKEVAFVGRKAKLREFLGSVLPEGIDYVCNMTRDQYLKEMARYKKIYAVDRTAIEGLVLGCEILPYELKYPDPSVWKILDNKEAAIMLQEELDKIDKIER